MSKHKQQLKGSELSPLRTYDYELYEANVFEYIRSKRDAVNLWLIIGATNKNYAHNDGGGREERYDYNRFKDYDLAISNESPDRINPESELIALTALNRGPFIYHRLSEELPRKFEKIIFDWSVTKFFDVKTILLYLEILLADQGVLYITRDLEYVDPYQTMYLFILNKDGKYYLTLNGKKCTVDEIRSQLKPRIILYHDGTMAGYIYNIAKLLPELENGFSLEQLLEHMEDKENEQIEERENVEMLMHFFTPSEYKVEYVIGENYPNERDETCPFPPITRFFRITRQSSGEEPSGPKLQASAEEPSALQLQASAEEPSILQLQASAEEPSILQLQASAEESQLSVEKRPRTWKRLPRPVFKSGKRKKSKKPALLVVRYLLSKSGGKKSKRNKNKK